MIDKGRIEERIKIYPVASRGSSDSNHTSFLALRDQVKILGPSTTTRAVAEPRGGSTLGFEHNDGSGHMEVWLRTGESPLALQGTHI
jgi:hypothetical protein